MKHNFELTGLSGQFYGYQDGPDHTLVEVYCDKVYAHGNDLGDCLINATLSLVDYHGNPAPTAEVHVCDVSNGLYDSVEQLICEAMYDYVCD